VLEPTVEGNTLDTAVEITSKSDGFGIDVGGTVEGNYLHDITNESWTGAETFATISATGSQTLRAPGASTGGTMRVRTLPLEVTPNAGIMDIEPFESDREIAFKIDPSSSVSEVDYRYHDTVSGETYYLFSETHEIVRDSDTAESPVSLTGTAYEETLAIILDTGSSDSTSSTSGGIGGGAISSTANAVNPVLLVVVAILALTGVAYLATRTEIPMSVVAGAGFLIAVLGLETISPGTITSGVQSLIVMAGSKASPVIPLVILIVVGSGAYVVVRWVQNRGKPDTQVTFQLRK